MLSPPDTGPLRMRRHRPLIVWLCLLALVWCQAAMAGQWCQGAAAEAMPTDCHGMPVDGDAAGDPSCPGSDVVPDLGKLPSVAPLPAGHDFSVALPLRAVTVDHAPCTTHSRDGPDLDALCRLLI